MPMTDSGELASITRSLDLCCNRLDDLVPAVYRRFFELDSSAASLMAYSDEHMRGRMFASVVELFLSDDPFQADGFLAWELENHVSAYAVTTAMYESLFNAFIQVLRETLDEAWCSDFERAWNSRIMRIMAEVSRRE